MRRDAVGMVEEGEGGLDWGNERLKRNGRCAEADRMARL